jgi:rhamnogalacturonan endolyase
MRDDAAAMKRILLVLLILGLGRSATAAGPACPTVELFHDDFSRFRPGWLSRPEPTANGALNGAIQEYHYLPHRGVPLAPWENSIAHLDPWVAGDEDGIPYVEQHTINDLPKTLSPLFVTGDPEWSDATVEVKIRPLSLDEPAGVVFRYATNRHYYALLLGGGKDARLVVRLPLETAFRAAAFRELGRVAFTYGTRKYYTLRVENQGPAIRAYIDGKLVLQASDDELVKGKVGITANNPARFEAFRVWTCRDARDAITARIKQREDELARLRAENPQPKLWKKFTTPEFGAGRNVRFGDLDGDKQLDMVIAQNIPRVQGDGFDHISALTAVTLDGKVLWRIGRPSPGNGRLTNDTPFQIHDIDGDGRNEVIMIRDFKLQILDGRTGRVKRWVWMPAMPASSARKPYELYSGDSIAFVNFTGKPGRRDLVLKDRYRNIWAFDRDLKLLWQGEDNTGHFPFPYDVDGDGRDELFIGLGLWDHKGKRLWSHDGELQDHVDALAVANLTADPKAPPLVYWATSDEGLIVLDLKGNILKHVRIGHTQNASIGKFRPDLPGLQYFVVNFWRSSGIVSLFSADGTLLTMAEPIHSGSSLVPVNWRGDGQELVLLSGNVREGGMIDGQIRRVVMFPDDGHPDLASTALDLTGDARDEIVLWDETGVWIYTQDRPAPTGRVYAPVRNALYNDSNYRANVSLPAWK